MTANTDKIGQSMNRNAQHAEAHAGVGHRTKPRPPQPHDALFRAIANYTYDWETWTDIDNRARWVNPAVERMTGYVADECLGMADYPLPIVHPDDRATIADCLRRAREGESGNDVEFKILHKDGSERWGAVSWQTISDDDGAPLGYRTSVRDITARKHTEQALRRAQQSAEKASADKSRFLASASHDLRQPIQAANMFIAALQNVGNARERDQIVASVRDSLSATSELLDALLDVSRLDAGVTEPTSETVHLADILEQIDTEFAPQATERDLLLSVVMSSQTVRTDAIMLLRIVRNLVSNALRYTEQGRVLVGVRRGSESARIEVWDTGIGIREDDIDKIFDDFRQLANPERDRKKGLGLGLAIVRRKAQLLGLDIDVRSTFGRGSIFSVAVPLASAGPEARDAAVPLAHDDIDLAGRSLLYIDDDETQLQAVGTVLRQWGLDVEGAASIEDAVALVDRRQLVPDVILADFRLREGQTGAAAVREVIRTTGVTIPAIILTGDTEPARIVEAAASGHALLHKPVSPTILKQTIHDVIDGRSG